ncbi:MAG: transposase, partial [Solibacillus sp.]
MCWGIYSICAKKSTRSSYSNGFLEGINNTSKVIKRHAFGFRK